MLIRKHLPSQSLTEVGDDFLSACDSLQCLDMAHTAVLTVGFAFGCSTPTTVTLPLSLTQLGDECLKACYSLQSVDLGHTALQTIGEGFENGCRRITTEVWPCGSEEWLQRCTSCGSRT